MVRTQLAAVYLGPFHRPVPELAGEIPGIYLSYFRFLVNDPCSCTDGHMTAGQKSAQIGAPNPRAERRSGMRYVVV